MKITISKFPNDKNEITYQVFVMASPICKETDEVTAYALARELLHKTRNNDLYLWDYYNNKETLLDRN